MSAILNVTDMNVDMKGDFRKDLREMYTPLSIAKKEIWRRWNDMDLEKKVKNLLRDDIPEFLQKEPSAYLARHIASPNFECLRFFELSKKVGLKAIIPEFKDDKLVFANPLKYYLANLRIESGNNNPPQVLTIVDKKFFNGKRICDTETLWGEQLVEFHHKLFRDVFKGDDVIFDISSWFGVNGRKSNKFYVYFLSLFIRNALLFENYIGSGEEGEFLRNVVLPSFDEVKRIFGCKPLIVRLLPEESEEELSWYSYGGRAKESILRNSNQEYEK